jgi:hypothetical protein
MKKLTILIRILQEKYWLRQFYFLLAAIVAIFLVGYHFGGYDQGIYLPFMKSWANSSLYPGDTFIALKNNQPSFFWFMFIPFYRLGWLEYAVFAVHLFSVYLTFWGIWELSLALFGSTLTAFISVGIFIFPHTGVAGFPIIEPALCNRTFVLPFLLFAITLYLRRKVVIAFLILGAAYNFHLLSVNFILFMLLFDILFHVRQIGIGKLVSSLVIFLLASSPVIIWRVRSGSGLELHLRPEWLSIVSDGILSNIYHIFSSFAPLVLSTFNGFALVLLFVLLRKRSPSPWHNNTLVHFYLAIGVLMAIQLIAGTWLPVTFIIQLQLLRSGIFLTVFSLLLMANFFAVRIKKRQISRRDLVGLGIPFSCLPFPAISCLVAIFYWLVRRFSWRWIASLGLSILFLIASGIFVIHYNFWQPGIHIKVAETTWYQTMRWAQQDTLVDAEFIVPPEKFSINDPEWRVFSERSKVVGLSDLLEVALAPDYLETWKTRFTALAPGALEQFRGNLYENQEITRQAFTSLTDDEIRQVACHFHAGYLVEQTGHLRNLQLVYQNVDYIIYDLRENQGCP